LLAWSSGLSGGDRHLLDVAAQWRDHVELAVLAPPESEAIVREFLGDVPLHPLGAVGPRRAAAGPWLAAEYVRRAVAVAVRRAPVPDVVVAASHFLPDAAAVAALVRRGAFGVAYVYHLIAERPSRGMRTLWSKNDERIGLTLLRRAAGIVFASNEPTASALRERGLEPTPTAIGIDVGSFTRARPGELPPRGLFLARLARTKGVTDAVEALARVRRRVAEAQLVMVGTGPERGPATALAERIGVADAVEWRGFVSEAEKRRILAQSRVLLAPSYEEGWGIAVCEALAGGVPVVAYRHPVLDEVFGDAYLAVSPGDVDGLAELAARVLTDASYAEERSQAGRVTAERYDVRRVAELELEAILRGRCAS
jgi:glycosyltransferase involved in cell wall biosynthesis